MPTGGGRPSGGLERALCPECRAWPGLPEVATVPVPSRSWFVLCGRQSFWALTTPQPRTKGFLPPSLYFRSACQHSNTRWRRPLPSRRVRTKRAASAWRLSSRKRQPQSGGSGSFPTATTRIACPASGSGGVPSSLRTQSSSKCSRVLTYRIWEKV